MSRRVDQLRRVRVVPTAAAVGLALAAAPLTWWAVGPLGTEWPDRGVGPYHVPLALEVVIAVIATALALTSVVAIIAARRHPVRHGVSLATTAWMVSAGAFGAVGWRTATAGVDGANIGGGLFQLVGPAMIAGLLVAAIVTETRRRQARRLHVAAWLILAVLVAPLLYAGESGLRRYDAARPEGVISPGEYASVRIGDTYAHFHGQLGSPTWDRESYFAAPPADSACDYYDSGGTSPTVYRICYRGGVVVAKQSSDHPR